MFTPEEKRTLLEIAREAIARSLQGTRAESAVPKNTALEVRRGVFVTLTKEGTLRGCIGRIEPKDPLIQAVAEMARSAAFNDPRFAPLASEDISSIRIEISVLSPLERLEEAKTLEIGRHGLVVRKQSTSGLLLPQVAVSRNWTQEEFLKQVCLKAGLPPEAWREEETERFVFTAEVFSESDV